MGISRYQKVRVIVALASVLLTVGAASAQRLSYSSGQNVSPGYEGWEKDADGTRYFLFGYMNRNWDEEPIVPVGADNSIEPQRCLASDGALADDYDVTVTVTS